MKATETGRFEVLARPLKLLFSTRAAGLYMLIFAGSIGAGTFIENDFGTSSAQHVIYRSWWFSLLLVLFCITIAVNMIRFKMVRQKKWALLTFHLAMIVILIGAGVTRYTGYEGVMHIRENDSSNSFLSAETHLQFQVRKGEKEYSFDEPVLFSTKGNNNWSESYLIGNDLVEVVVKEFIPNPKEILEDGIAGKPTIKIVIGGANGREEYFLSAGETRRIRGTLFNFADGALPDAVNIAYRDNVLLIKADQPMVQRVMATQKVDTLLPQAAYHPLMLRSLYMVGSGSFVFGDFNKQGVVQLISDGPKVKNESLTALRVEATINGDLHEVLVYGQKGQPGRPAVGRSRAVGRLR